MFKNALNTITNIIEPGTTIDDYTQKTQIILSVALVVAILLYPLMYASKFISRGLKSTCNVDSVIFSYLLGIVAALVIFYIDSFYLLILYFVLYAISVIGSKKDA